MSALPDKLISCTPSAKNDYKIVKDMIMEVNAHTLNFFAYALLQLLSFYCLSQAPTSCFATRDIALAKSSITVDFFKNSIITRFTISNISSCRTFTFQQDYPFFSHFINNSSRLLLCKPTHLLNFCGSNLIVALQIF